MNVAVLDLGTNVFNLLLANFSDDKISLIKEFKVAAKLGSGGLKDGSLPPLAFASGRAAFSKIMDEIELSGGADKIVAYATSAVRDATNGAQFGLFLEEEFGVHIDIIAGEREAELIYKGINSTISLGDKIALMLDIGGGSNEFIIADSDKILWKESFPLGMARMRERFLPKEPITSSEIETIRQFWISELTPLWAVLNQFKPDIMFGSSGSFDTFRTLLFSNDRESATKEISLEQLLDLHRKLIASTTEERMAMEGMSKIRVEYIVLASLFTQLILERSGIEQLYQSSASLKEGAMEEEFLNYLNRDK